MNFGLQEIVKIRTPLPFDEARTQLLDRLSIVFENSNIDFSIHENLVEFTAPFLLLINSFNRRDQIYLIGKGSLKLGKTRDGFDVMVALDWKARVFVGALLLTLLMGSVLAWSWRETLFSDGMALSLLLLFPTFLLLNHGLALLYAKIFLKRIHL